MNLIDVIKRDIVANNINSKGKVIVIWFRLANYIGTNNFFLIRLIGFPIRKLYQYLFIWLMGIEIHENTSIGFGLQVWHGTGLVINPDVVIGNNVLLRHNTTIGNKGLGSKCPRIGNNVDIGAHSVLIGDIEIGDNVVIGAGTIVTKSIPSNTTVYGNPLIIKKN